MLLKRNNTLHDFPYHLYWFGLRPNLRDMFNDNNYKFSCLEEFYLFRFSNINSFNLLNLNHSNNNFVNVWFDNLDNLIKCFHIKYSSNKSKIYLYEQYFQKKFPVNNIFDYKNPRHFY
ncbi:hypothetical protein PFAG_00099 [Plasmodium falciparum Santa Lucia]|uniref:Uncharacterized protein n=12 Tax=Plasmodium falciparum TaxID=5833 RepID=Q8I229_PLAF7|nr:conserved protein, unknown function [Plasmodium falciparum 3D7]ETW20980.1 hypothetical protein PFFVO_00104 [Plasmodium falciparum Vietnam Oak-Knoll (FVO)]ETW28168.1 hypothetical protein PFFCH_04325 [Plasmodium falciparum FCH/4]ETW39190.1 hypothetical protein PFTANZ_00128 [Plasmodium falciparum Tanzania (2000708)]ETW45598.1 hypothetical protein PFNF135_00116 [Plasmodium falciparum NF135/5.C10]ETW51830.1 hypothetical protein PFMALIP_00103 [Plasmodium falciparum MaliPS096_E11]ETW57953.1 hypot|eukprot:XP_001351045.1 conserved Plasmodium protein, unknown function [Plasmodium falciparum 3D7]